MWSVLELQCSKVYSQEPLEVCLVVHWSLNLQALAFELIASLQAKLMLVSTSRISTCEAWRLSYLQHSRKRYVDLILYQKEIEQDYLLQLLHLPSSFPSPFDISVHLNTTWYRMLLRHYIALAPLSDSPSLFTWAASSRAFITNNFHSSHISPPKSLPDYILTICSVAERTYRPWACGNPYRSGSRCRVFGKWFQQLHDRGEHGRRWRCQYDVPTYSSHIIQLVNYAYKTS